MNRKISEEYKPIKSLGRGAFGDAILARHTPTHQLYVLKRLPFSRPTTDEERMERQAAEREVQVLCMLQHPHICGYKESFVDMASSTLNIVLEFCEKGDFGSLILRQKEQPRAKMYIQEDKLWVWATQMLFAVDYVHRLNILHRDIKPANLFLSKKDTVKLGDFGIAKVASGTTHGRDGVAGTSYYLAPEICENHSHTAKSDIWALGVSLYEIAALKVPFGGGNVLAIVNSILTKDPPPLPTQYSVKLQQMISAMLTKRPQDRPSADQLIQLFLRADQRERMDRAVQQHVTLVPPGIPLKVPLDPTRRSSRPAVTGASGSGPATLGRPAPPGNALLSGPPGPPQPQPQPQQPLLQPQQPRPIAQPPQQHLAPGQPRNSQETSRDSQGSSLPGISEDFGSTHASSSSITSSGASPGTHANATLLQNGGDAQKRGRSLPTVAPQPQLAPVRPPAETASRTKPRISSKIPEPRAPAPPVIQSGFGGRRDVGVEIYVPRSMRNDGTPVYASSSPEKHVPSPPSSADAGSFKQLSMSPPPTLSSPPASLALPVVRSSVESAVSLLAAISQARSSNPPPHPEPHPPHPFQGQLPHRGSYGGDSVRLLVQTPTREETAPSPIPVPAPLRSDIVTPQRVLPHLRLPPPLATPNTEEELTLVSALTTPISAPRHVEQGKVLHSPGRHSESTPRTPGLMPGTLNLSAVGSSPAAGPNNARPFPVPPKHALAANHAQQPQTPQSLQHSYTLPAQRHVANGGKWVSPSTTFSPETPDTRSRRRSLPLLPIYPLDSRSPAPSRQEGLPLLATSPAPPVAQSASCPTASTLVEGAESDVTGRAPLTAWDEVGSTAEVAVVNPSPSAGVAGKRSLSGSQPAAADPHGVMSTEHCTSCCLVM
eukprot:TRINITY_DN68439_c0_g1_i1.p1 TRINITY_DN68439_c0_g1~~TRINITY_DN68439_c0_g1_i1.p1  ORF type:complete len:886 (+),score=77.31 TRINITY_DN68439_c0_g1_i1:155-2812(+)